MVPTLSKSGDVNVLISNANWAWPQAVERIFRPRGVNALMAETGGDMLELVNQNKIHLAILDMGLDEFSGLQTLRMIRQQNKQLPCILLAQKVNKKLLAAALELQAFTVMDKPVDLNLLANQIDRLFLKCYASDMFSETEKPKRPVTRRITQITKWTFRKQ